MLFLGTALCGLCLGPLDPQLTRSEPRWAGSGGVEEGGEAVGSRHQQGEVERKPFRGSGKLKCKDEH